MLKTIFLKHNVIITFIPKYKPKTEKKLYYIEI